MMYEKKKIIIERLIILAVLILGTILLFVCFSPTIYENVLLLYLFFIGFLFVEIVAFALLIASISLSYKIYDCYDNTIIVYAGFYHHYLKINGEIVDEYNSFISRTPIEFLYTLQDEIEIKVTISLSNSITLKINGRLMKGRKA